MLPFEKLGCVVCFPLIPKSVERTVWKVATATRVPGEPGLPQTFYFQACSDLKRQCLHKDKDSDEGNDIYIEVHVHMSPRSPSAGGIPLATGVGSGVTKEVGHKNHFLTGFGIGL